MAFHDANVDQQYESVNHQDVDETRNTAGARQNQPDKLRKVLADLWDEVRRVVKSDDNYVIGMETGVLSSLLATAIMTLVTGTLKSSKRRRFQVPEKLEDWVNALTALFLTAPADWSAHQMAELRQVSASITFMELDQIRFVEATVVHASAGRRRARRRKARWWWPISVEAASEPAPGLAPRASRRRPSLRWAFAVVVAMGVVVASITVGGASEWFAVAPTREPIAPASPTLTSLGDAVRNTQSAQRTVVTNTKGSGVMLRKGLDGHADGGARIDSYPEGTSVRIVGTPTSVIWRHVLNIASGKEGYVPAEFTATDTSVDPVHAAVRVVKTGGQGVWLRADAANPQNLIETVTEGAWLNVVGADVAVEWQDVVMPDGRDGYVQTRYLADAPTP